MVILGVAVAGFTRFPGEAFCFRRTVSESEYTANVRHLRLQDRQCADTVLHAEKIDPESNPDGKFTSHLYIYVE